MNEFSSAGNVPLLIQPGFLDDDTCVRIRNAMDRGTDDAAEVVGDAITRLETIRRTRSIDIEGSLLALMEERIEAMRRPLERRFGRQLGQREGTGFLRYQPGGFYLPHRDRGEVAGWPAAGRRAVATVVFLNGARRGAAAGDFDGGTLCLYPVGAPPVEIRPQTGLLVAFPAELLHEVRPVREGTRDTAVDWFYDGSADETSAEPERI